MLARAFFFKMKEWKDKVEEISQKVEQKNKRGKIGKKDKSQESVHFVQYLNNRSLEREQKKQRNFSRIKRPEFLDWKNPLRA